MGTVATTAGALTGFKIHLRACRFRFDATPNRRPQVSQTKAIYNGREKGRREGDKV